MRRRVPTLLTRAIGSAYTASIGSTMVVSVLAGVGGIIATRALGPDERGLLAIAVSWSALAGSLSAYGLPGTATYFVSRSDADRGELASTVIAIACAASLVVALIGTSLSLALGGPAAPALAVSFVTLIPGIVGGAALGAVLGTGAYKQWGLVRVLGPGVTLLGTLLVVVVNEPTALAITVVNATAAVVQAAILLPMVRRRRMLLRPTLRLLRPVVSYASRNVLSGAGWLIALRIDQIILSVLVAPAALGYYAVACSFGALLQPIAGAVGAVVLRRISRGDAEAARSSLPRVLKVTAIGALVPCALLFVFAHQVVLVMFGSEFDRVVEPLRWLLPGTAALLVAAVLADSLRALGRPLAVARASFLGAAVTAVSLPLILPEAGISGAAAVSSISYCAISSSLAVSLWRVSRAPAT